MTTNQDPKQEPSQELDALIKEFVDWWFYHNEDSLFFNKAMKASPRLAKRIVEFISTNP